MLHMIKKFIRNVEHKNDIKANFRDEIIISVNQQRLDIVGKVQGILSLEQLKTSKMKCQ